MGNVIAVLTTSKENFNEFRCHISDDEGDTEYVRISTYEETRGRLFSGYTCLVDWYSIGDKAEILNAVISRIK